MFVGFLNYSHETILYTQRLMSSAATQQSVTVKVLGGIKKSFLRHQYFLHKMEHNPATELHSGENKQTNNKVMHDNLKGYFKTLRILPNEIA